MKFYSALFVGLLLSVSAVASQEGDNAVMAAEVVIAEYKELRKACAETAGDARKACFSELNQANPAYQQAKETLAAKKQQDVSNVHLVSYVY